MSSIFFFIDYIKLIKIIYFIYIINLIWRNNEMIDNLCPKDLLVLANALAISLSEGKTADELNVLGNHIVAVGSLMLTAAAQMQSIASKEEAKCTTSNETQNNNEIR